MREARGGRVIGICLPSLVEPFDSRFALLELIENSSWEWRVAQARTAFRRSMKMWYSVVLTCVRWQNPHQRIRDLQIAHSLQGHRQRLPQSKDKWVAPPCRGRSCELSGLARKAPHLCHVLPCMR